ncbi:thiamine pathway transporter Thi73p [[Candida] jaroonii]|uniref:Thiamine pathway transporter Thi73p n=1 Tax=[Candida] jaroonii TaxID=467808 RepID=A0ACA9Y7R9_9ASCO|nr:thiamine pathway transporter Thi73p [[Candida] jaroonii]
MKKNNNEIDVKSVDTPSLDVDKGEHFDFSLVHEKAAEDPNFQYLKNFDVEKYAHEDVTYKQVVKKLYKQFAWIMTIAYFLQFIDKVMLNYARIMGLVIDLNLVGNQFSDLPTYFFVAYIFGEFFQSFLIQRYPVTKVLGANIVIWGILTGFCALTRNFAGILTVRILLGLAESAVIPCMVLITTNFVDTKDTAFFTGIWYCGSGLGQIFGGLISYLFQLVSPTAPVAGWRIMFIVIGILNAIVGIYIYFFLPSTPLTNSKLTPKEKYVLLLHLNKAKIGINEAKKFSLRQLGEFFMDIQAWLFFFISATISFSSNTISTFSSLDIMSFGFTSRQAALLNMPSGVVSIVSSIVSTYFIRKGFPRFLAISILLVPAVCGGALMSFLPKSNQAGLLIGIYMINTVTAPLAICYAWAGANVAGSTKKIAFTALAISGGFCVGNITGPQSYRAHEAPDYYSAKISMLATQAVSIVLALIMAFIYYARNKARSKYTEVETEEETWADRTDFENKSFRYIY